MPVAADGPGIHLRGHMAQGGQLADSIQVVMPRHWGGAVVLV